VCIGGGRHKVEHLREYSRLVRPGRPDLGQMDWTPANVPPNDVTQTVMQTVDQAALDGDELPTCPKCGRSSTPLDDATTALLFNVLDSTEPGRVLRFDVSTGRLL
jgi:hypothetical protein